MFYKFKRGHNITEATKNIFCVKGEGPVDDRGLKKFCSIYKNLDYQVRLGRPKITISETVLQSIAVNLMSSTWRVLSKLSISQSSEVCHLHNLGLPNQPGLQNTLIASLQKGKTPPMSILNNLGGEASVILELWGMQSTPTLPSLPGPL